MMPKDSILLPGYYIRIGDWTRDFSSNKNFSQCDVKNVYVAEDDRRESFFDANAQLLEELVKSRERYAAIIEQRRLDKLPER